MRGIGSRRFAAALAVAGAAFAAAGTSPATAATHSPRTAMFTPRMLATMAPKGGLLHRMAGYLPGASTVSLANLELFTDPVNVTVNGITYQMTMSVENPPVAFDQPPELDVELDRTTVGGGLITGEQTTCTATRRSPASTSPRTRGSPGRRSTPAAASTRAPSTCTFTPPARSSRARARWSAAARASSRPPRGRSRPRRSRSRRPRPRSSGRSQRAPDRNRVPRSGLRQLLRVRGERQGGPGAGLPSRVHGRRRSPSPR